MSLVSDWLLRNSFEPGWGAGQPARLQACMAWWRGGQSRLPFPNPLPCPSPSTSETAKNSYLCNLDHSITVSLSKRVGVPTMGTVSSFAPFSELDLLQPTREASTAFCGHLNACDTCKIPVVNEVLQWGYQWSPQCLNTAFSGHFCAEMHARGLRGASMGMPGVIALPQHSSYWAPQRLRYLSDASGQRRVSL